MENQLIPYIINESGEVIVSGRELHDFLQIKTPFKIWIPRMIEYGFEEKFNSPEAILDRLRQLLDYNTSYSQNSHEEIMYPSQVTSQIIPSNPNMTNQLVPSYMADNYNSENFSDLLTNFRDTAKMFGMKENILISWLILRNFCYRYNYNSIRPYSQYMKYFNLRPFKSPAGHSGIQALINSRGRDYFTNLLMNENLMEVEYISVL